MSTTEQVHHTHTSADTLAAEKPRLDIGDGVVVRPWVEGDDLKLLEVWGDPQNPMHHRDRASLGPSSQKPWSRCIVAEVDGVTVAAATIFRSSLHPDRLSFYVEVAQEQRRHRIAAKLLNILEQEMANSDVTSLRARCAKGSAAQCFLKDNGFRKRQASRQMIISPGALTLPDVENLPIDLEDIATGSVELSQLVANFYNAVHEWDRADMTVGKAQQVLLSPQSGASGAVVLRHEDAAALGITTGEHSSSNPIIAFAISYTASQTDDPADVLVGWSPQLSEDQAEDAVRAIVALLTARYPISVEVVDSMVPLQRLTAELATMDATELDFEALIYARDAKHAAPETVMNAGDDAVNEPGAVSEKGAVNSTPASVTTA